MKSPETQPPAVAHPPAPAARSAPMRQVLLAPLALAACAPSPPPVSAGPAFDPITFFEGRTRGTGELSVVLSQPRSLTVEGVGRVRPDGALVLRQRVEEEGRPPRNRRWEIRRTGPGRYAGALSDATGPVRAEASGGRLRIRYPSADGQVEQWLTLSPDGRSARNRLTVKRLGVVVARVEEVIRKYG